MPCSNIPRLAEDPGKIACMLGLTGFGSPHDSWRLSQRRRSKGPDRAGARWLDGLPRDAARQRPVLLDAGNSCQEVAEFFLCDDDTIRGWHGVFGQRGIEGLTAFDVGGSSGLMNAEQAEALKAWVNATLPRSTRHIGAWIAKEFGLVYESRSGLI